MAIIEINKLSKSYRVYQKQEGLLAAVKGLWHREYREVEAVKQIDLKVEQGEFVAFLGPNGAGKTTTLKLLSGVIYPTSGHATVMGHTPWQRENDYRRRFALVMGQKNQLWWDLPAQESFRLHEQIYRIDSGEFKKRLDELSDLLDVGELLGRPVRELSLGERMKMELIAALLHSPEVLFLDEPTIGLDVVAQHNIQQFLKYYQQERKITILLTSHYMKDIAALCKRVVVITDGSIKFDGSLNEITDSFSGSKLVRLQLAEGQSTEGLDRFAKIESIELPRVTMRCSKQEVTHTLASVLQQYEVEDVSVEDPPFGRSDCEPLSRRRFRRIISKQRGVRVSSVAMATDRLSCWWMIFRTSLEERLAYRGDFALGTLMRFLPIITQIFLWKAIFDSLGADAMLVSYRFEDMVAYYLLSMLGRAFSSMPGLASTTAKLIREGEIKKFLVQPIDMIGFTLLGRLAHKTAYYTIATLPFALVFFLCRDYFTDGWPNAETMLAFAISLVLAFLLGYFLDLCIGLIGFWFLEVSSLLFVYMLLNFFLSGHMFPLDLLPSPFHEIVDYLPFKYLAYFPAAIFLQKVEPGHLWYEIGIECLWLAGLIVVARTLYARGLRRYSGYGG